MRAVATMLSIAVMATACVIGQEVTPPAPSASPNTTLTADEPATLTCWTGDGGGSQLGISLTDVTEDIGALEPLKGMHGHAAIWTDVNHDDRPDLYVGTYSDRPLEAYLQRGAEDRAPDRLLIGHEGGFAPDDSLPEVFSRSSGGVTADLDNDGDLDLVVSRNVSDIEQGQVPSQVLENVGGRLTPVEDPGIPAGHAGRAVAVFDYDLDGLLDIFIAEDHSAGDGGLLLHNDGGLGFSVDRQAGIPEGVHGLGVSAADLNGDGRPDVFVGGSNRLFLSDGEGRFTEADSTVFVWERHGPEDDVAGVSIADVDRDADLDMAVGHHFNSTVEQGTMVAVRLYLNDGEGAFTDVTERAGIEPFPTKAPHVELNDLNNDGWPDLLTSASAGDGPAIFVHRGLDDGLPRFEAPDGLGDPQYWVAAPTADIDRDGRLDVFLLEWEPALPSLMLRNETEGGNWLEVSIAGSTGFGIGWRVEVSDDDGLLGAREINVTQGYAGGVLPIAHFGLGDVDQVDVRLIPPGERDSILLTGLSANQHVRWPEGC
jgi:hypothetical protein